MFMRVSSVVRCALYAHCSVVDKFLCEYSRIPFIFKSSDRNFLKFQIIKEKGLVVSEIYVYLLCTRKTEKMKVTTQQPEYYYEWGNEPSGHVSTWREGDDGEVISTGYVTREKSSELNLKFNCPYS